MPTILKVASGGEPTKTIGGGIGRKCGWSSDVVEGQCCGLGQFLFDGSEGRFLGGSP